MKKSKGNMYSWTTHTHSHLGGRCEYECDYCYVQSMARRFPNMKQRYTGELRILPGSMDEDLGSGNVVFIDHMNDLFAKSVPGGIIHDVLWHIGQYPDNRYVFQTRNPRGYRDLMTRDGWEKKMILGTTIETDNDMLTSACSFAPEPVQRAWHLGNMSDMFETFVTIEPIMNFHPPALMKLLEIARPDFVCIGADSKGGNLSEPSSDKIEELISEIELSDMELRGKRNLERLL